MVSVALSAVPGVGSAKTVGAVRKVCANKKALEKINPASIVKLLNLVLTFFI